MALVRGRPRAATHSRQERICASKLHHGVVLSPPCAQQRKAYVPLIFNSAALDSSNSEMEARPRAGALVKCKVGIYCVVDNEYMYVVYISCTL